MRRATAILAALLAVALIGTAAAGSDSFTDVSGGHTFHDDIGWLADNGLAFGYGDGTYGPDDNITRGQMAAFLHRFHDRFLTGDGIPGPAGPQGPQGEPGPAGPQGEPGLANLATDGPYPGEGATLQDLLDDGRAEFGDQWTTGQVNLSAVRCADGKAAIGGGYKVGSGGPASSNSDVNVTASYPAYIDPDGTIVSEVDGQAVAINPGTDDWSFVPNGWVVEGYYDGAGAVTVRPFVTCGNVG